MTSFLKQMTLLVTSFSKTNDVISDVIFPLGWGLAPLPAAPQRSRSSPADGLQSDWSPTRGFQMI